MLIKSHDGNIRIDVTAILCLEKKVLTTNVVTLLAHVSCLPQSVELLKACPDSEVEDLIAYISNAKDKIS
jgi:hypothetical protein